MPRILRSCRTGAVVSVTVLLTSAAMLVATDASASTKPLVTISSGPTVDGDSAALSYGVNRRAKAIDSRSCSLSDGTTTVAAPCGTLTTDPKDSTTYYSVTLDNLSNGTYVFTVGVVLTDSGATTGISTAFTIDVHIDTDSDGIPDSSDNCPTVPNADQSNWDGDSAGNDCDPFPVDRLDEINCDDHDDTTQDIFNPGDRICVYFPWDPLAPPDIDDNDPTTVDIWDPINQVVTHTRLYPYP